ncbi:MAG: hypothetical protein ABI886_09155 [Betaproteobacteria bacterium]
MSGVKRERVSDGIFVHTRLTVDASDTSDQAQAAIRTLFDSADPMHRLQAILDQLDVLYAAHPDDPLVQLRYVDIQETVTAARRARDKSKHRLDLIDLADAKLRELGIYLKVVPDARRGKAIDRFVNDGARARAAQYEALQQWCCNQAAQLQRDDPSLTETRLRTLIHRRVVAAFERQRTPTDPVGNPWPPEPDAKLHSAVTAMFKLGRRTPVKRSIENWLRPKS